MVNQKDIASVVELRDWIVNQLNAATWSIAFDAVPYNLPLIHLEELDKEIATVSVFPISISSKITPRCNVTDDQVITIQAYRGGEPDDIESQDEMIDLCEKIRDFFSVANRDRLLPGNVDVYEAQIDAVLDNDVLTQYNAFSARMGMLYKTRRKI